MDTDSSAKPGISPAGAHTLVTDLDEPPPGRVLELAAACVRFVLTKYKVELDFTPDTLPMVDHYVDEARAAVVDQPATLALTAHAVGAYLGEVVRRHHACWWRIDDDDPGAWRLEFRDVLLTFYPVEVAYTALTRDDGDAAFSGFELPQRDKEALIERLEQLPAVSEDEYFAP